MRLITILAVLFRERQILAVQDGYSPNSPYLFIDLPDSVLVCPKEATTIEPFMYEGFDYAFVEGLDQVKYNIALFGRQWRQGLTCYYASSHPIAKRYDFLINRINFKIF